MIKSSDIRIGNWILSPDGKPMQVYAEIFLDIEDVGIEFNPIELTPEWLLKYGVKSDDGSWEYQINVGAIKWYFRWNVEWYSELGGIYMGSHIKYVHQLQNLYYSLTENELNN